MLHKGASSLAAAGDDVDYARWEVRLLADIGEGQRGQGRGLGRLEHDRVASGERGGDLPGQHEHGEVPRDDLAGHADRPGIVPEPRVLQLVRPSGVVEEVGGDERDVDVTGLADGLAVVDRLQHRQFAGALLDQAGDAEEILRPVGSPHRSPDPPVRLPGRRDGGVHIGRCRLGDLGQDLLGGGVHCLAKTTINGVHEGAVDEEPIRGLDVHNRTGLRGGCVVEGRHGLSPG
jgi:hypothetical protein